MEKRCRKCWDTKDVSHFDPDRLGKYWVASTCKTCKKEKQIRDYKPIQVKSEVKKVWKKTLTRLKEKGSETRLFNEIWNEREHKCQECWKYLKEPKVHNFDHIKPKWKYPELRMEKTNIKILCFRCHFIKTTGLNYKWPDLD